MPKRHDSHFETSDAPSLQNLAWMLRTTIRKIDKVLERPAYNFMVHSAPVQEPTRKRVLAATRELHFSPNGTARTPLTRA